MYFSEFINQLSRAHDIDKTVDGAWASYDMVLPLGTNIAIRTHELNHQMRSHVRAGAFVPPIDRNGRDRFTTCLLNFNRNSLSYLDAGLMPDPQDDRFFNMVWYVPVTTRPYDRWVAGLSIYESLVISCAANIKAVVEQCLSYKH